jgi:DNA invertase Pin-like site-specific DNA recombinase
MIYVAYLRVSTQRQGVSGLGLDAQRQAVCDYVAHTGGEIAAEFTEVESGASATRDELRKALERTKELEGTLLIAKLDRLSRNMAFIANLMESGVKMVCCDMPEANELTLHIIAAMAQYERRMISERTKVALEAAKRRGVKLGNPRLHETAHQAATQRADSFAGQLYPTLQGLVLRGCSRREMVSALNKLGVRGPNGGRFHLSTLQRVLERGRRIHGSDYDDSYGGSQANEGNAGA